MRFLVLIAALLFTSVAEARYCQNYASCKMCNRIFGPAPGYQLNADYTASRIRPQQQQYTPQPQQSFAPVYTQPSVTYSTPSVTYETSAAIPTEILQALDPTSQSSVDKMLALLAPTKWDTIYDLGSGDGRVLLSASRGYGTPGIGIEINPESAELSRDKLDAAGIDNVRIVTGDATKYDFSDATLITMYLYPQVIKSLLPNLRALKPGTRVISYSHPIPLPGARKITVKGSTFYLWITP